jgi:acyl-CoA thioesterase
MEPQALAEACAATMWAGDEANRTLATRLAEVAPGRAVMCLDLGPQHLNSHGICHGGFIFALADSAFRQPGAWRRDADRHGDRAVTQRSQRDL